MPLYTIVFSAAAAAGPKTMAALLTQGTRRGKITKIIIGASGAPADNAAAFRIKRGTADGTGTSFTAVAKDPAETTAITLAKVNYTAEPTYTAGAILLEFGLNQRATYTWFAIEEKDKLTVAASAVLGLEVTGGPALVYEGTVDFEE